MAQGFENWNESMVAARNAKVARGSKKVAPAQPAIQETFALERERASYLLVLPWPPSNNHYKGNRVIVPKDGSKPFVMYYLTEEAKKFKSQTEHIARAHGIPVLKGAVLVAIKYFFPTAAGDLTNRDKVLLDVLQGIAYENDRQITRKEEERFSDKNNPRVEITIQERQ